MLVNEHCTYMIDQVPRYWVNRLPNKTCSFTSVSWYRRPSVRGYWDVSLSGHLCHSITLSLGWDTTWCGAGRQQPERQRERWSEQVMPTIVPSAGLFPRQGSVQWHRPAPQTNSCLFKSLSRNSLHLLFTHMLYPLTTGTRWHWILKRVLRHMQHWVLEQIEIQKMSTSTALPHMHRTGVDWVRYWRSLDETRHTVCLTHYSWVLESGVIPMLNITADLPC